MTFGEIQERVSSADLETLKLCSARLDSLFADEKSRVEKAEDKAKTVIAVCGVASAILGGLTGTTNWRGTISFQLTIVLLLLSSGVFALAKAAFFSLKALVPLQGYRASFELIFELQRYPHIEAIRYDTVVKIWVYERTVPINNAKLFYVQVALENIVYLIVFVLLASFFVITFGLIGEALAYSLGLIILVAILVLAPALENFGTSWKE